MIFTCLVYVLRIDPLNQGAPSLLLRPSPIWIIETGPHCSSSQSPDVPARWKRTSRGVQALHKSPDILDQRKRTARGVQALRKSPDVLGQRKRTSRDVQTLHTFTILLLSLHNYTATQCSKIHLFWFFCTKCVLFGIKNKIMAVFWWSEHFQHWEYHIKELAQLWWALQHMHKRYSSYH